MKKLGILLILLCSFSIVASETIISLEVSELFENLGYGHDEIVQLKSGDFGEGGGGNRPIKAINSGVLADDSLIFYYPIEYRISFNQADSHLLGKIPLHAIKVINMTGSNSTLSFTMDQIHSFDLAFGELVDLNEITANHISAIITINGDIYFPSDIDTIEIEAIIEP